MKAVSLNLAAFIFLTGFSVNAQEYADEAYAASRQSRNEIRFQNTSSKAIEIKFVESYTEDNGGRSDTKSANIFLLPGESKIWGHPFASIDRLSIRSVLVDGEVLPFRPESAPKQKKKNPSYYQSSELQAIQKQIVDAVDPRDRAKTALMEWIFGKTIARNVGIMGAALDPVMLSDGTVDGYYRTWEARCDTFLKQEADRQVAIQINLATIDQANRQLQTGLDLNTRMNLMTQRDWAIKAANSDITIQKQNLGSVSWCRKLKYTLSEIRETKGTSIKRRD